MSKKALGRGLSYLLKEDTLPISREGIVVNVNIEDIEAGDLQPRKYFDDEKIRELATSIAGSGLLQPIIVSKEGEKYKIIAGERRYRACKLAGINNIPVMVKELSQREKLEIALIENIQRAELTAIEEAEGFELLLKKFGYSQNELASAVGKSRSHVANLLRLNQLPDAVKQMINEGSLSMGQARCLIGLADSEELAATIIADDLNVRQVEELIKNKRKDKSRNGGTSKQQTIKHDEEDIEILSHSLSEKFGVKVIVENFSSGGKICFYYDNLQELDSILTRFN